VFGIADGEVVSSNRTHHARKAGAVNQIDPTGHGDLPQELAHGENGDIPVVQGGGDTVDAGDVRQGNRGSARTIAQHDDITAHLIAVTTDDDTGAGVNREHGIDALRLAQSIDQAARFRFNVRDVCDVRPQLSALSSKGGDLSPNCGVAESGIHR